MSDLATRLLETHGSDTLAQATHMVAEASVGGTDADADLCAELMNDLMSMATPPTR